MILFVILALMIVCGGAYIIAKDNAEFEVRWNRNLSNHDDMEDRK